MYIISIVEAVVILCSVIGYVWIVYKYYFSY
jgi:hypothetical protein